MKKLFFSFFLSFLFCCCCCCCCFVVCWCCFVVCCCFLFLLLFFDFVLLSLNLSKGERHEHPQINQFLLFFLFSVWCSFFLLLMVNHQERQKTIWISLHINEKQERKEKEKERKKKRKKRKILVSKFARWAFCCINTRYVLIYCFSYFSICLTWHYNFFFLVPFFLFLLYLSFYFSLSGLLFTVLIF